MSRIYLQILLVPIVIFFPAVLSLGNPVHALDPDEVAVVVNRKVTDGRKLAEAYMSKRKIPPKNLVVLETTAGETCSRDTYEKEIAVPVRLYLNGYAPRNHIRCLVLIYGLPLKVSTSANRNGSNDALDDLIRQESHLRAKLKTLRDAATGETSAIEKQLRALNRKIGRLKIEGDHLASVDSELALVLEEDHPTAGWVVNPYFLGAGDQKNRVPKANVLMVCRLDGPDPETVKRLIDDSLAAEKHRLTGIAYFDARWPKPIKSAALDAYRIYDRSIHNAAATVVNSGHMPVVIEATEQLFQPGQCPQAALYCGWYSLAKYVDAFQWQPGAVGYHIASAECTTLKKAGSNVWCKRMLEKGAAAVIGPVGEPYVSGFPLPEIFFGYLVDGYLTLAECYQISLPYLSWKMVLIGDPLYRPFKNNQN